MDKEEEYDFNLERDSTSICSNCRIIIPAGLNFIRPIYIIDRYIDLCPSCERKLRKSMITEEISYSIYLKYISWKHSRAGKNFRNNEKSS